MIILIHAQVIYNVQYIIYNLLGCDMRCITCIGGMSSTCNNCKLPYINILSATCICSNNQLFDTDYGICTRN